MNQLTQVIKFLVMSLMYHHASSVLIGIGFYSVLLQSADVFVELTVAGPFTGLHRYTYFGSRKRYLIFDPTHAVKKVI